MSDLENATTKLTVVSAKDTSFVIMKYTNEEIDAQMTVQAFKEKLCNESDYLKKKKKIGPERVMLSYLSADGDGKQKVYLKDKKEKLGNHLKQKEVVLQCKDIGP